MNKREREDMAYRLLDMPMSGDGKDYNSSGSMNPYMGPLVDELAKLHERIEALEGLAKTPDNTVPASVADLRMAYSLGDLLAIMREARGS